MASFKLNLARIRGCPAPREVLEAMQAFGLPEKEEFGVLNASASDAAITATIVRKSQQAVQTVNPETREISAAPVEKVRHRNDWTPGDRRGDRFQPADG